MKQRDNRVDFYKGMLMWGVIWGHTITCLLQGAPNEVGIHPIFRTYDMPFFMLISGYFFSFSMKKYSFMDLIKNKITTIALPTILWTFISSKFSSIFSGYYFLWAVFLSSVVLCTINKIIPNKRWQIPIHILIILVFHFQPYPLVNMPYLFPYFVLGYYGYEWMYNLKIRPLYILPFFIGGLCFWRIDFNIWNAGADFSGGGIFLLYATLFRTFIALSGIVIAKWLFDILYRELSENHSLLCRFIVDCGKETLALYILHVIVLSWIVRKLVSLMTGILDYNIFEINHLLLGYFIAPLLSLGIMMLMMWGIKWSKKNRYTDKLFGFKI